MIDTGLTATIRHDQLGIESPLVFQGELVDALEHLAGTIDLARTLGIPLSIASISTPETILADLRGVPRDESVEAFLLDLVGRQDLLAT